MGITYDEPHGTFKLDTEKSSYIIGIADGYAGHAYYGKRVDDTYPGDLLRVKESPYVPSEYPREECQFNDSFPYEYPASGRGDFRYTALDFETGDGYEVCELKYSGHRIYSGKKRIEGLPAIFGGENEAETLELELSDERAGIKVTLFYSVFPEHDVIAKRTEIRNTGKKDIILKKAMSSSITLDGTDYEIITLHGNNVRERKVQRQAVPNGTYVCSSRRGETGHDSNCFMAVCKKNTTEDFGEAIGINLVYSGNFAAVANRNQFESCRFLMGINPELFSWNLKPEDCFDTPECVYVYSDEGIGGMSRRFHDLYRQHLIRSKYVDKPRPILINNWEATYFDFNSEKLLSIAKQARECGIEMLVMDDGWFGHRENDESSLGDWQVNENKLPGGLKKLADDINGIGLKFGIWMEPEMISRESQLYKKHPDWVIRTKKHEPLLSRCQLVLDITKEEVKEYVWESVNSVLSSANIEYLKWDMNRYLSDVPSGELSHRYVLAVYELQERLVENYPDLLLENCSAGGGRFDPGILYFAPQIWCSDNMDPIERLSIQRGTAMCYPLSTMGAHVCSSPNHTTGRLTPLETRGAVALAGTFGYELDITKLDDEEKKLIKEQTEIYREYSLLVRNGDYYRIANFEDTGFYDAYMVVSKDKTEALVTFVQVLARPFYKSLRIKLKGLDEKRLYDFADGYEGAEPLHGSTLMNAGINIANEQGDFTSRLIYLRAI